MHFTRKRLSNPKSRAKRPPKKPSSSPKKPEKRLRPCLQQPIEMPQNTFFRPPNNSFTKGLEAPKAMSGGGGGGGQFQAPSQHQFRTPLPRRAGWTAAGPASEVCFCFGFIMSCLRHSLKVGFCCLFRFLGFFRVVLGLWGLLWGGFFGCFKGFRPSEAVR